MIDILFQNDDFIAVDKPYGISVHNNEDPENLLLVVEKQLKIAKLYPVHRLDKETSGVQVFALNEVAARKLSDEFQKKTVLKIYRGILKGQLKQKSGAWVKSLSDKAEGRKNPAGLLKNRVLCKTLFRVLKSSNYFTSCEFSLITGRQHQIRKHAALANHVLVGDARYGDLRYNQKIASIFKIERMLLHCLQLEILGQRIESPLPSCFLDIFNSQAK
ncbi:MAG: RNA pseudouridine synthase [Oligoflexia bacterium]|nr:RNA pseudouridine synthase [Oligoflexia bacterium]